MNPYGKLLGGLYAQHLEQLRALNFGTRIRIAVTPTPPPAGIDTEEDLRRIAAIWER